MDAWQRFVKTIEHESTDHVPVALIGTNRFFSSIVGVPLFEILHDPMKMIEAQYYVFQRFPDITFIPGAWPDYGAGILSAYGCKIFWSRDYMPQVSDVAFHSDKEVKAFSPPNPFCDGMMPWYLQTLRMFAERQEDFKDNLHFLWSLGPGELATFLWGANTFLLNLYEKPGLTIHLLETITESILIWLKAQQEINGRANGHILVFHNDTLSNHILKSLSEVGIDVFNLGKTTDLAMSKRIMHGKVSLLGNLDPLDLLTKGSSQEVIKASKHCFSQAAEGGGFILSAGGGMNAGTLPKNLDAMVSAAREYGKISPE
jgi:uroporphyrinogen decarboxylase